MEETIIRNEELNELHETLECVDAQTLGERPDRPDSMNVDVKDNIVFYGSDEQRAELINAFTMFFAEVDNPVQNKLNPFTKSMYATLDNVLNTVREPLAKHGLSIVQHPLSDAEDPKKVYSQTLILHKSGGIMAFSPFGVTAKSGGAQDIIAALTYARRGALSAQLGIHSEADDDGNQASGKKPKPEDEKIMLAREELVTIMMNVSKKIGRDKVYKICEEVSGVKNPNAIDDIKLITDIKNAVERAAKKEEK